MKSCVIFAMLAFSLQAQSPELIKPGSKVYVDSADGFDIYLTAAAAKKHVSLTFTTDRSKADYELQAVSAHVNVSRWYPVLAAPIYYDWLAPVWPQVIRGNDSASVRLVNIQSGDVVFAYSVDRNNSFHNRQTAAESCAKHLRDAMKLPGLNF